MNDDDLDLDLNMDSIPSTKKSNIGLADLEINGANELLREIYERQLAEANAEIERMVNKSAKIEQEMDYFKDAFFEIRKKLEEMIALKNECLAEITRITREKDEYAQLFAEVSQENRKLSAIIANSLSRSNKNNRKATVEMRNVIINLQAQGLSNLKIALMLRISPTTLYKSLKLPVP